MRNIALAVIVSALFAANAARANDTFASDEKGRDAVAAHTSKDADTPKDVTAASPVTDEANPMIRAPRVQPRAGSLAGATLLRTLHVSLAASQAYDVYSTAVALKRGAVEKNPLLQNTVGSRAAFIGLKIVMTAGPILEAESLWRSHHRVGAIALMAASNGIMMAVAAHNTRIMNNAVTVR